MELRSNSSDVSSSGSVSSGDNDNNTDEEASIVGSYCALPGFPIWKVSCCEFRFISPSLNVTTLQLLKPVFTTYCLLFKHDRRAMMISTSRVTVKKTRKRAKKKTVTKRVKKKTASTRAAMATVRPNTGMKMMRLRMGT